MLWPRLPHSSVDDLLGVFPSAPAFDHPDVYVAESGGARVDEATVRRLRERIIGAATSCGYPGDREKRTDFDRIATRILFEEMGDNASDLYRPEIWNFITLVLLPDVAAWRWPPDKEGLYTEERLRGRNVVRNAFSRLWIRAYTLGPDLIEQDFNGERLQEDNLVQVVERSGLARHQRFARCHTRLSMQHAPPPGRSREDDFRMLTKLALRRVAFINPEILNDDQLEEFVTEYVDGPEINWEQTGPSAANREEGNLNHSEHVTRPQ